MIKIALFEDDPVHQEKIRQLIRQSVPENFSLDCFDSINKFSTPPLIFLTLIIIIRLFSWILNLGKIPVSVWRRS